MKSGRLCRVTLLPGRVSMVDPQIIIVGAGTAGCVLARRVVERTGKRVLLIEAGARYPA